MTVDYPDWQTPEKHALEVYRQAVPLARKPTGISNGSGLLGGTQAVDLVTATALDQPSFHMLLGLQYVSNLTNVPFGRLRFLWTDSASGFQVDDDWCMLPGAFGGLNFAYISGEARADSLVVELENLDPGQLLSYSWGISQTSHVYDVLRVQEVGQVAVTGVTRAGQNNQMGILASVGANVPAGGSTTRLASTWHGQAKLSTDNSSGTATITVQLLDPGIVLGASPLYGAANSGIIASMTVPSGTADTIEVTLPAGPVLVREINGSATVAQAPTTTLTRHPK